MIADPADYENLFPGFRESLLAEESERTGSDHQPEAREQESDSDSDAYVCTD